MSGKNEDQGEIATNGAHAGAAGNGAAKPAEAQTIDQVRELLFGSEQRSLEQQIVELRAEMASDRAQFEQKLEELQAATARAAQSDRERSDDQLRKVGEAIRGVGEAIAKLPG